MRTLIQYLAIGCAGFVGAVLRVAVATMCGRVFGIRFPYGTFIINITGSFLLGWFLTFISDRHSVSDTARLAIGAGFVGAYTTFSTLMFETNALADEGAGFAAILNLVGSILAGVLAVRFGIAVGRRM